MSYKILKVSELQNIPTTYTLQSTDIVNTTIGTAVNPNSTTNPLSSIKMTLSGHSEWFYSSNNSKAVWLSAGKTLYVADVDSRVGIGTLTPSSTYKLDVSGSIRGIGAQSAIVAHSGPIATQTSIGLVREVGGNDQKTWEAIHKTGGSFELRSISDLNDTSSTALRVERVIAGVGVENVSIHTGGFERLRTIVNGNVGIGTALPTTMLHVSGVGTFQTNTNDFVQITPGDGALELCSSASASYIDFKSFAGEDYDSRIQANRNGLNIMTNGAANSRLCIASGGNVGIGIAAPTVTFHVSAATGSGLFQSDIHNFVSLDNTGGIELCRADGLASVDFKNLTSDDFDCRIATDSNGLKIWTGGNGNTVANLNILSNGNVGVGTTTPSTKLHVTGNILGSADINAQNIHSALRASATTLTVSTTAMVRTLTAVNIAIGTYTPQAPLHVAGDSSIIIPAGFTLNRPDPAVAGMIRLNTSTNIFEGYAGTTAGWSEFGPSLKQQITMVSHGFVAGDVIRLNGGSGYIKAQANSGDNSEVVGIVESVISSSSFVVVYEGVITGLGGLTVGEIYFLSSTVAGAMTVVEPTTQNFVSKPVMHATSETTGVVVSHRGLIITDPTNISMIGDGNSSVVVEDAGGGDGTINHIVDGNNILTVKGSTSRVGVHTTDPLAKLHINSNDNITTGQLLIRQDSTGDAGIQYALAGDVIFHTGIDNTDDKFKIGRGSEAGTTSDITVMATGQVGIGTSVVNLSEKLTVQGNATVTGNITNPSVAKAWITFSAITGVMRSHNVSFLDILNVGLLSSVISDPIPLVQFRITLPFNLSGNQAIITSSSHEPGSTGTGSFVNQRSSYGGNYMTRAPYIHSLTPTTVSLNIAADRASIGENSDDSGHFSKYANPLYVSVVIFD